MKLLCRPISASDRIPDRFCVISMEFLFAESQTFLLAKRPSAVMSKKKRLPFAGYTKQCVKKNSKFVLILCITVSCG